MKHKCLPFSRRNFIRVCNSRRTWPVTQNAFTLVELLVVMTVISILMAILLPTLSRARKQALTIACAGNLRQVSLAMGGYSDDWKGLIVPVTYPAVSWNTAGRWNLNVLRSYVGGNRDPWHFEEVFICKGQPDLSGYSVGHPDWQWSGYGLNGELYKSRVTLQPGARELFTMYRIGEVRSSSQTIAVFEINRNKNSLNVFSLGCLEYLLDWERADYERHLGKSNFLFLDSHVKLMHLADTSPRDRSWESSGPLDLWDIR